MAYSVPLNTKCQKNYCEERATEEVYAYRNDKMGRYCKKHAAERVGELTAAENRQPTQERRDGR